jgi:DNA-binding LacI/PurR family transcriptional regulator
MARKSTIADVAILADVSTATVDRALNGRGSMTA